MSKTICLRTVIQRLGVADLTAEEIAQLRLITFFGIEPGNLDFNFPPLPQPSNAPSNPKVGETYIGRYGNGLGFYTYNGTQWELNFFHSSDDRAMSCSDRRGSSYIEGSLNGPQNPPSNPVQGSTHLESYDNAIVIFNFQASGPGAGWDGNNVCFIPLGAGDIIHRNNFVSTSFTVTPTTGLTGTQTYTFTSSDPANATVTIPVSPDPSVSRFWIINDSPNGTDLTIDASALLDGLDNGSSNIIPAGCKADISYDEGGQKVYSHLICERFEHPDAGYAECADAPVDMDNPAANGNAIQEDLYSFIPHATEEYTFNFSADEVIAVEAGSAGNGTAGIRIGTTPGGTEIHGTNIPDRLTETVLSKTLTFTLQEGVEYFVQGFAGGGSFARGFTSCVAEAGLAQYISENSSDEVTIPPSSDYATSDLTADGARTHNWGTNNQTENFTGGQATRDYDAFGQKLTVVESSGTIDTSFFGGTPGITSDETMNATRLDRDFVNGTGTTNISQTANSFNVETANTNNSSAWTSKLDLTQDANVGFDLTFQSQSFLDGTTVGIQGRDFPSPNGITTELLVKTGDVGRGSATAGDVLTLIDAATGEAEYQPISNVATGSNFTSIEIGEYRDLTFEVPSTLDGDEVITFPIPFSSAPNEWDIQISIRNGGGLGNSAPAIISGTVTATQVTVNRDDGTDNAENPFVIVRVRGLI